MVGAAGAAAMSVGQSKKARIWLLSIFCSVLPDFDVIAFYFGIPYGHLFGHRGFFHSPVFALILSLVVVTLFYTQEPGRSKFWIFVYFFGISASHGILDALTNGGLGIALLAPFNDHRYFFPVTPIEVSPIGIRRFLSPRGWVVMTSEMLWVWTPLFFVFGLIFFIRTAFRKETI